MEKPIHQWSARETASKVRSSAISAQMVTEDICNRITLVEPLLNAFADFDADVPLEAARAVDRRLAAGEQLPLAGVTFTVKDNLWLQGRPATFGSKLFESFHAPRDSWAVARMRELGAVPLGLTNCAEFASRGVTVSPLHGATRNPWDLTRSPGGSSGGAVAAVAAGLGQLALATDAGGSTRRPAALTGLVGMKPTLGRVPDPWGFDDPNHQFSSVGQIGRSVEDVAWMLDVLTAWEPADPRSLPICGAPDVRSSLREPVSNLRIAWSPDLGLGLNIDVGVKAVLERTATTLADEGWQVTQAAPDWPEGTRPHAMLDFQRASLARCFGAVWRERPEIFDPSIGAEIELGFDVSGATIMRQLHWLQQLHARIGDFFEHFDAMLCPVCPVEAWVNDEPGPAMIGGRPADPRGHAVFTPLFNYAGLPAVSLPCGFGPKGLPVGFQIVGPRYADARVLQLAWHAEGILGAAPPSPLILQ